MKAHVGNLERAVKEKLPTQTLLDILGSLKKEVVATEQLLRVCNNLFLRVFAVRIGWDPRKTCAAWWGAGGRGGGVCLCVLTVGSRKRRSAWLSTNYA